MSLKLFSEIKIIGVNPYVLVESEEIVKLVPSDWKKPIPVIIQVNGQPEQPWHINMVPVGNGDYYLYLHGDVRKASNTKVGDTVEVEITFDEEYKNGPQHPMPSWFKEALDKESSALKNWEALSPSRKKEVLRYFSWLKSENAIQRNLEKAMKVLSGKTGRLMGREWKKGI